MPDVPKKSRRLRPVILVDSDWAPLEAYLAAHLKKLYASLIRELGASEEKRLTNSEEDVVSALARGEIQYVRGHFEGTFSAAISRELKRRGATWDKRNRYWKLPESELTVDMRLAIATSESRMRAMAERVNKRLAEFSASADSADPIKLEQIFDTTLYKFNKKFDDTISSLKVAVKVSPEAEKRISREYTRNLSLEIKDWTMKETVELRRAVETQVLSGFRRESLAKAIEDRYDVSRSKAKFLARQETSLMTTKLKQVRYQASGINKYQWDTVSGSPEHPVRPMHKALYGTIHTWDDPPIVDKAGHRKHPGQDFNCRCRAIPIVEF